MELYLNEDKNINLSRFYTCDNIFDSDIDLYDADTGKIVFSFKKKVIDDKYYKLNSQVIKYSKTYSSNRGDAAGVTNVKDLQKGMEHWKNYPVEVVDKNGSALPDDHQEVTSFIKMKNGMICKRKRSNQVKSQSIGGYDKSNVFPCRLTNWTARHLIAYKSIFPLCKVVSDLYFSYFPDYWLNQYDKYSKSPKDFVIPDTNFSTLTINANFRTAAHKDKGDCKDGLTCFSVIDEDDFGGGELCFPTYDIGINVRQGDLVIFDPHVIHCNNKLKKDGRISLVFYLREKLHNCENK